MATVKSIQFRFKSPTASPTTPASQSLFTNIDKGNDTQFTVILEHTTPVTSGSYSGSIVSSDAKYADLSFIHEGLAKSASISLPFIDGGWWSVMVTQKDEYTYTLYASNKVYDGVDGNTVGFEASHSFTGTDDWTKPGDVYFPGSGSLTIARGTYTPFTGSLQELRYFTDTVTKPQFRDFVQDSNSIEGSSNLLFRAALGGELYRNTSSIHPGVGTPDSPLSFSTGNNFTITNGNFRPNYEIALVDQVGGGIRNRSSTKIKKQELILPTSSSIYSNIPVNTVLAASLTVQQQRKVSNSLTRNVNYAEVALSPQNEINDDINATHGYLNIGEYIGDPRDINNISRTYLELDNLRETYFTKYSHNYNYSDYIRLSKYYDNAVFQMVKDYVPVRTGLATGIVIKQHLLERNKVRPAQVSYKNLTITGSLKAQSRNYNNGTLQVISAGPGGSVNSLSSTSQIWNNVYNSPIGVVNQVESSQYEFFNGEYSGSTTTAQVIHSINSKPLLNNIETSRASTLYQDVDYSYNAITPVNINLILNKSATPATVPDSNYSSLRSINSRYLGSKNTGDINYKQLLSTSSIAPGTPIDNFTPWFAHFNGIYGSAELGNGIGGNLNVTELINAETKDRILMTTANKNIDFLGQLFKQGDTPFIAPIAIDQILEGAVEIEAVGELYQTILMKSGSVGTGYNGTSFPNGAITYGYSTATPDTRGFHNGIAVTQSLDHYTFPSQASWRGYAPTTAASEIRHIGSVNTVTTTTNLPNNGLPPVYTTFGTQESQSLAAGEIKRTLVNLNASGSSTTIAFADFDKWTITSGSITEADNNLIDLPNEWVDNFPLVWFYFSASAAEITSTLSWSLNYQEYSSSFEDGWFDLITANPVTYPINFPSAMQSLGNVYIYNKVTNEYTQETVNPAEETYFPLQRGDFIRVGTTASMDTTQKVGSKQVSPLGLMRTISYTPGSDAAYTLTVPQGENNSTNTFRRLSDSYDRTGFKYNAGLLTPLPEVEGLTDTADYGNQNFRIIRRIPTEFYILLKNRPGAYTGEGLLLPHNFNPKYNAKRVAQDLGVIKMV